MQLVVLVTHDYFLELIKISNVATHKYVRHKGKGLPQQAEVVQGVSGRLRPQIFLTFGTTRVVGCQPNAPAAFTPGEIPGTHFLEAELTPGNMVLSVATEKNP